MATKTIALDAGHGLKTAGKQTADGKYKEWTLNDKVRDYVVEILKDYDVKIIFTDGNEGATDESLASRLNKYINAKVDAFISIHHNANTGKWNSATGVEIFTDKNPTSKDTQLAKAIYTRLVKNTGLKGRGIKKENWYVINQNRIPAVLVEGGFMDSKNDYAVITSSKGQMAYAEAVAYGVIEFLGLKKKTTTTKVPVMLGGARKDENGNLKNGKAGDQLQKSSTNDTVGEVSMKPYYDHELGWYGFRFISDEHAKKFTEAVIQSCNNKNVGYDQNNRYDIMDMLEKYGSLEKIAEPTECVCSSLIRAEIKQATGKDLGKFLTDEMPKLFEKSGLFKEKIEVKSEADVEDGMILVTKTKGHAEAVVSGKPRKKTSSFESYKVKITAKTLNVRKGSGISHKVVGVITSDEKLLKKNPKYYFPKTTYTIVEEKMIGSNKWGKLKSGAGWIHLGYTKKA